MGHSAYSEYSNAYGLNSIKEKNLKILKKHCMGKIAHV
jgi:hypothetical protein